MMLLAVTLVAAAVAGLVLGMLGGGGSILTLPILMYLAEMPTREAIGASLVVVGATSMVAVIPHARTGRVQWRTAAGFAAAGVVGAYVGGRIADRIPATVLLGGFGFMMAAAAVAMLRLRTRPAASPQRRRASIARAAPLGGLVGLVTGLIGAGGGFVIVPVLVAVAGLGMAEAVGTSLVVIAAQSAAGLLGHLNHVQLDWPLTFAVTAAAVTGSLLGARVAGRLPHTTLRIAFGWLVIAMAIFMLLQQVRAATRQWRFTTAMGWATLAVEPPRSSLSH